MQCVNHPGVDVQSFCQNCGKGLCANCVRTTASGQVFCETCFASGGADQSQAYWQQAQAFVISPRGTPNPSVAAVLGLIPGVGAMYNGQLFKGLIHVVIFAVLVSITENYGVFGIFIGAWVLYQSFEAFHTAKARRDGLPLPDPFGLNELGSWLNLGSSNRPPNVQPGQTPPPPPGGFAPNPAGADPAAGATGAEASYSVPYTSSWSSAPSANPAQGYTTPPYNAPPYSDPYAGSYPPGYVPPVPPMPPAPPTPPYGWRGREPVWAVVLIVLGLMFLLKTMGFVSHLFHYAWPVLLIGFGVWMIVRRVGYTQGGPK